MYIFNEIVLVCMPIISSRHWFRWWLGAVRQKVITWADVDSDLCYHMASLGHWVDNVQPNDKKDRKAVTFLNRGAAHREASFRKNIQGYLSCITSVWTVQWRLWQEIGNIHRPPWSYAINNTSNPGYCDSYISLNGRLLSLKCFDFKENVSQAVYNIVLACICLSICPPIRRSGQVSVSLCINHELVCVITHHLFKLEPSNSNKICWILWLRSLLIWVWLTLNFKVKLNFCGVEALTSSVFILI